MKNARTIFILSLAIATACGGLQHGVRPTIEQLRQRARERPEDPAAQIALAEGELLLQGGDASRARAQIERAAELSPDSLRLSYLDATERSLHGDLSTALDAHLDVIRRAATSDDPLAPAMAAVAAAEVESLDDAVDTYAERVSAGLTPVHADPRGIGDEARATIADLLIDLAFRRGDLDRVREVVEAQRCSAAWRVAGPFGPRHLLGFDQELAPDHDDVLADSYDLGPGRGERATREVPARGCNAHIGGAVAAGPGTTFAETTLMVPEGGRWLLRLETPNAVQLFVDGEPLVSLDRRRETMPRATFHALQLDAGERRIRARITSRHPNPVVSVSLSRAAGPPGGAAVEGESLTAAHVAARYAMARGDVVAARELLRSHLTEDGSSTFLVLGGAAALSDPLRSATVRHDQARRLLGWAAERDEGAFYPRLAHAQLEASEGRVQTAIAALREATERWPQAIVFPLQLVDYLSQRGWHGQAADAIADARRIAPSACRPRRAAMTHARRRHRAAEALALAEELTRCDARSDAVLTLRVQRREWDLALAELRRMTALEPRPNTLGSLRAELEVATARGDEAEVARLLSAVGEHIPQSPALVLRESDRLLARGGAQPATAHLNDALAREPAAMMELRRTVRAIGGPSPLESFRRDGAEVISRYEASGRVYEEPMVLVYDYTVYRVFEDRSMLELTHNIFQLRTQEAVDAMGEFGVPEGAQMLTLRTVKADGTRLEPDEIAGKDTISFPSLSPGDYIEFEYLRPRSPPAGYPNGFAGDRFYFRNYETPFDLSQLTVVTPPDVELMLDPRGRAPETETSEVDGLRVYRWTARESRPFTLEPASIPVREFFPSIYWGRGATWPAYVESLRDVLADRDVIDPAARRLVREIVGETDRASVEQVAARIYLWVLTNIENSDDVFGLAPAMIAARTGNRTRVLRYLLDAAGLEVDLALARSYASDSHESALADDDTYQNLLVRMRGTEGYVWLHAGSRGAPFGYIPPVVSGMDALLLNEDAEVVRVSERDPESELRTVEVDVDLENDGGARVSVIETYRGAGAAAWRNQLESIPEEHLEIEFESQYVSNLLPGGQLARLVITGREDPESDLVLRYDVTLSALARRANGGLVVPPIYRATLGASYAPVASREVAQLLAVGLALDVEVRVRVPNGASIDATPSEESLEGAHGARATIARRRDGEAIVLRRSYRIPRMRIAPEEYPDFARFCRAADEAEGAELRVHLAR